MACLVKQNKCRAFATVTCIDVWFWLIVLRYSASYLTTFSSTQSKVPSVYPVKYLWIVYF